MRSMFFFSPYVWQKMDPVALVQGALAHLQRARDAIQGGTELKTTLRQRYGDYSSIIKSLKSKPEVIAATKSERELLRLSELFTRVADLIGEYTAAPGDSKAKKASIKAKRAADWENVNKELHEIDADVMRQLGIMSLNGVVTKFFNLQVWLVMLVWRIHHVRRVFTW